MNKLFLLTEYPSDVLPMYAQGYSVCQFLIAQNGPRSFVKFLGDYMENPSWTQNVRTHYGYESLAELQQSWLAWVSQGSGPVELFVKNAPQNNVVPASLQVALPRPIDNAATQQQSQPTPTTDNLLARGSATGSSENGWYSRLRQEAISGKPSSEPSPLASSTPSQNPAAAAWPRSLGPQPEQPRPQTRPLTHSAAQPQPEQGMSAGGVEVPPASGFVDPHGGFPGERQYLPGSLSSGGSAWR